MASTPKGRILVVDDDQDIQEIMSLILEGEGYEVMSAPNGQEALSFLLKSDPKALPELIILDSLMPIMGGAEFLKALRDSHRLDLDRISVLLSSGNDLPARGETFPEGIPRLKKPMGMTDLIDAVSQRLQR